MRRLARRDFLRESWALSAALAAPWPGGPASWGGLGTEEPEGFDRPLRWAQLTLVENDPGRVDLQFWLDYFREIRAEGACLSAGGCVAYYPSRIPLHHRSAWLGDGDPFGELVQGCRDLGIVVLARTDPHSVLQEVYEAHPEWIAVDENGHLRSHWATPGRWVTCGLGPYNFDFMTDVHREIIFRYPVDGIFVNRWSGSGMCYCRHCQANFRAASGRELPRHRDPRNSAWREYLLWRQERLFQLWQLWDSEIRKINPRARCIPNTGGGALSDLDMERIGRQADILMADRQGRRGLMAPWANGKNGKEYRAAMRRKPIVGIFSVGLEEPYRWKDSVQNEAEIRIWVADGIANGLRPWFTKFSGMIYDSRWLEVVRELYQWHHSAERYLRNERPLAQVAVVYSQQTSWFYGGMEAWAKVEDHLLGMYQALIEAHIPFEMVHDRLLEPDQLRPYRTLILPNVAALSDQQCRRLEEYVRQGGSLVATFETSLYDEWGVERGDFGLGELLGIRFSGQVQRRIQNSYLQLEKDPATGEYHPLLRGLEDTSRIINGVQRVDAHPRRPYPDPPLTLIPSYPDLPMEEVYPREVNTGIPEVYLQESGPSRIVYFPWDIDRTFWEVLCLDHGRLLANAVDWACRGAQPVHVEGPGVLDITVWRQRDSLTMHLVNLTNPMFLKGPFREPLSVGPQRVRVRLPEERHARKVQLLVRREVPAFREDSGFVELVVPSILYHEVVAVDL